MPSVVSPVGPVPVIVGDERNERRNRASDNGVSYFCSHCGTKLCGIDQRYSDIVGFLAGTLRGFEVQAAEADYFYSDRAPWYRHGNVPIRYEGDGEDEHLSG